MMLFARRAVSVLLWLAVVPLLAAVALAPFVLPTLAVKDQVSAWWSDVPGELAVPVLPQRSTVLDADGNVLAELYLYNRTVVSADAISPLVKQAIVAVEDRRFYTHPGVDLEGLGRAVVANARAGTWAEGGSTITQQYVKNLLALSDLNGDAQAAWREASEKTLDRKFREARLAMALERRMTKDEILTGYLNTANYGNGAYGIEAAARFYFGVPAIDLDLAQAALLAGVLQSPTSLDPLEHPQASALRRSQVLSRMLETDVITAAQFAAASAAPLPLEGTPPPGRCPQSYAPFYCAWVTEELLTSPLLGATEEERRQRLAAGGLVIRTALSPDVQAAADRAVAQVPATNRLASAIAMVEPGTGAVRALATSRQWGKAKRKGQTELLLPTREAFQTGSTFKPFTMAAALDAGISPDTVLPAGSTYRSRTMENPDKGYFSNYDTTPWRNLTLKDALKWSVNTAFIQLQEKTGTRTVARVAHDLGLANLPITGPARIRANEGSLTLGARETSVLNVANGYASLAAGGVACPARGITAITTRDGQPLPGTTSPTCRQVVSPAAAAMTASMMGAVITEGTGKNAALPGRPAAGKTGTTNNSAAVWFAGFVPQLAAAVWIGDPRGPSYSVDGALGYASMTGGTLPAQIWRSAMSSALKGSPVLPLPGATRQSVLGGPIASADQQSGLPAVNASS
jgi:membrane peptidoglycan carboxypeptidase